MNSRLLVVLTAVILAACSGGSDLVAPGCTNPSGCPDTTTIGPTNVQTGFVAKTYVDNGTTYKYQVFIPAGYNASTTRIPIILFLHGSGEKGTDNQLQLSVGLGPVVKAQAATFPAIVVFPQSGSGEGSGPAFQRVAVGALDQTLAEYTKADKARQYLTGLSYGGVWSYNIALAAPTRFAAFVPMATAICVSCMPNQPLTKQQAWSAASQTLKSLPIWQFQGDGDPQFDVNDVRGMVAVFKAAGDPINYTEYAGMGHEIWDRVYAEAGMWTWLYAQKR
jgi:predicted peptidase